jgi:glycosyltransferase involved in cell wall biosynthesis
MHVTSPWSRDVAQRLAELGHDVHVFDFQPPAKGFLGYFGGAMLRPDLTEFTARVHLHTVRPAVISKARYIAGAREFRDHCRRHRIDLVLALGCGGFAALTYLSGYRPYAVFATGSDVLLTRGLVRQLNRRILAGAAAVFANGRHLQVKTRELTGREDVQALVLGTDPVRFGTPAERPGDVRILCTRGFLPVYNNESLIQALALIPETLHYRKVVFTSSGPTLDGVKALAERLLSPETLGRTEFLGGVSAETLLDHLRQSSIFVSMSRSDGTSISLLEAMACGLFPVVSDIPPNREWIDPRRRNGLLVPLDRPRELAAALEQAVTDSGMRARAAEINRQIVLERADSRANIAALARELEKLPHGGIPGAEPR